MGGVGLNVSQFNELGVYVGSATFGHTISDSEIRTEKAS